MKSLLLIAPLVVLGFLGCSHETPEQVAAEAKEAYAARQWSTAITRYEQLLKRHGDDAELYYNLALAAYQAGDYGYAQQSAKRAITLAGGKTKAEMSRELLGMIEEAQKNTHQAITLYTDLIETATSREVRVRVRSRLARVYMGQQRVDAALALLLAARSEDPMSPSASYNLGKLCMKDPPALHQAALDAMLQAEHLLSAGSAEKKDAQNCVSRLRGYLKRVAVVPPAGGDKSGCAANIKKAEQARSKKQWTSAERYAKKATEADPASYQAFMLLARIAKQNNHTDVALKAYEGAIALKPLLAEPSYEAAALAYQMKRYAEALTYLRPAIAIMPKKSAQVDLMTRILFAQRRNADARVWGQYYLGLVTTPSAARDTYKKWVESLPIE